MKFSFGKLKKLDSVIYFCYNYPSKDENLLIKFVKTYSKARIAVQTATVYGYGSGGKNEAHKTFYKILRTA